jgi:hypothetical protein
MKNPSYQRQQGAALLMMMLALIAISSALAYQYLGDMNQKLKRQNTQYVTDVLVSAKDNLLAFTESIPELYGSTKSPGFFLCPDLSSLNDPQSGLSSGSCGWTTNNAVGRLPSIKKDDAGTSGVNEFFYFAPSENSGGPSLWYAVDDLYRNMNTSTANPLSLTPTMTLDGQLVVAVVIAANVPLSGQINGQQKTQQRNRTESASQQLDDHLEALVSSKTFISRKQAQNDLFNDQVIAITKADLDSLLMKKVCDMTRNNNYCNTPPTWFSTYGWSSYVCPTASKCN